MEQNNKLIPYDGAPVHPLSVILTLTLDYLWTPSEVLTLAAAFIIYPILMAAIGYVTFKMVLKIQTTIANDPDRVSVTKAYVMAIVAAVPYPVVGTVIGGALLAWAGVSAFNKRRG